MRSEGMAFKLVLVLLLFSLPSNLSEDQNDVTIVVNGSAIEAEIDDSFVCATIDWWPHEKCNYNQCPWGNASVLNLDLNHSYLSKSIQAFSPLRIRVGGSLEDQVVYGVGSLESSCDPFTYVSGGLFGFSEGCLSMGRWDELNRLFQKTGKLHYDGENCAKENNTSYGMGAIVTFGLNALYGRHRGRKGLWQGAWNSSNARDFMEYTISKGYPIDSWEFGNELSGNGVSARVGARQYAKDLIVLKAIIDELYDKYRPKPLIVAPGGFFDNQQWYVELLEVSGAGVLNAMSHHVYNLGAGDDSRIVSRIMDPNYLSRFADTFRNVELTIQKHGPWSSAWVGEAGGAYNSGSRLVSNTFLNSFWYLDQLGMAAKYDTKVYCRQTLIGGNYGLLDLETFIPNPDFYSALLWHRLMGKGVLSVDIGGSPYLRAYAHCRKQKVSKSFFFLIQNATESQPGVSMLLINLSKSTGFVVTVRSDQKVLEQTVSWFENEVSDGSERREEYHLSGKDGDYLSRTVLLNGNPLKLTEDGEIPELIPVLNTVNHPLSIAPLSIAFVVFPNFEAVACA